MLELDASENLSSLLFYVLCPAAVTDREDALGETEVVF